MSASTRLQHTPSVVCERGEMCVHDTDGHTMNPVRLRLALATPSGWSDAIVLGSDANGVTVATVRDGAEFQLWHHADVPVNAGEPVAVHARYGVLAAAGSFFSIAH